MTPISERIQVVFFDAGGTLFEVRGSVGSIYAMVARRFNANVDIGVLDERFVAAFRRSPLMNFPELKDAALARAERDWWFAIVENVLNGVLAGARLADFFDEVYDLFRRAEAWRVYDDARETLERLRHHGYRLGVISNFDSRLDEVLEALSLAQYFERVIASSRSAAAKPARQIFQQAVDAMNIDPAACLHIGDSPLEDAEGARRAGLCAALLDRSGKFAGRAEDWCVRSLIEICEALGA